MSEKPTFEHRSGGAAHAPRTPATWPAPVPARPAASIWWGRWALPSTTKKLKHAGLDYWHYLDISYYDGLDDFFAKNSGPYYYFTTKAPQRYTDVAYPDGAYLVFGREDAGLPEALLAANQEHCIRMPMRDTCRSLNLSNSVAVGVYEVLRQWDFPGASGPRTFTRLRMEMRLL
mgnify:CR=1 FL=1